MADADTPWNTARGSWYSQFNGQHNWVDNQDRPGSNALGVPDDQQGIALPSRGTLGQWFDVQGPDGTVHRLQQTDIGPHPRTGRGIDISAAAAERMGFAPHTFPTDARFSYRPADGPPDDGPMAMAFADGSRGALSPDGTSRGRTQMADPNQQPPSLAAQFLTGGPGALFGKPDTSEGGYNWGHALNNAAAWMQSLDTKGASLGAIKNQEDYSLVPGPDGSVYKIHKPTGKVTQISGPLPKILERGSNLFGQKLAPDVQVGTKVYRNGQLIQDYANPGATPGAGGNANVGGGNTPSVDDTDLEAVAGKIVGARETNGVTDTNELLKMLPVAAREPVRARLEGRSNVVARGLDSRMIDRLAETINPEFNAAKIKTAQETISSLSDSKKQNSYGSQRVAAEKLFNELALAAQAYDTLGPNGFKPLNQPVNAAQRILGVGNAPAQKTLAGMSNTLSEQATRVARGVGGAEADIKRQLANIGNYNENPAAYYAGLSALADSILGTVHGSQAVVDEAVKAMPKEAGKHQILTPGAEAALKHFKLRALRAQGLYNGPIPDMKTPSDTYSEQSAGRPPLSSFLK